MNDELEIKKIEYFPQNNYDMFFEKSPLPIIIYDTISLKILDVNSAASIQYGYSEEEFKSMSIAQIRPDNEIPKFLNHVSQNTQDIRVSNSWIHKKKDGTLINTEVISHALPPVNGLKPRLIISLNVTEKYKLDKELKESEQKFRILTETSKSAIFIFAEDGFKYVNPATIELTGYSEEEFYKMKFWDIIHPDFRAQLKELGSKQLISKDKQHQNEVKIITKDGTTKWFDYIGSYIEYEGSPAIIGNAFDITQRKKTEILLRESEERFSGFMDNMPIGTLIMDNKSNVQYANKQFLKDHGTDVLYYPINETPKLPKTVIEKILADDQKVLKEGLITIIETIPDVNGKARTYNTTKFLINRSGQSPLIACYQIDITEKLKIEEELLKSKKEYQSFFDDDLTGDYSSTPDGKILKCNLAFLRIFGLSSFEEAYKLDIKTLYVDPQDRFNLIEELKKKKRLENIHLNLKQKDGKNLHIIENILGKFDENNELYEIRGYIIDDTDRKIAETQLKKISKAIEQSPVSIVITDKNGIIEYVNPKFLSLTGYTLNEVLGKNPKILKSGHTTNEEYSKLWKTILNGGTWHGELLNKRKDGTLFWEEATISPIKDGTGKVTNFIAVKEDITSKREAKEKIKFLAYALENINESVYITDAQGIIIYTNKAFQNSFGYEINEIIGKPLTSIISHMMNTKSVKQLTVKDFKGNWKGELLSKRKDGGEFPTYLSISEILDEDGKSSAFIGVSADITERKKVEETLILAKEKAEELNRIKDVFFANMSHELRTPLIGILGYAELMRSDIKNAQTKEMADIIYESGKRLNNTLDSILDISKIESLKSEIHYELTDINLIINQSVKLFEAAAFAKNLVLRILPGENKILGMIEPEMFSKVINNLINNAIKYTDEGHIYIQSVQRNDKIIVSIEDTGIGIAEKYVEKIFEPFRQVSEGASRKYEGTGLGLTIVKKYLDLMDGKIYVKSDLGKGSTFTIEIPIPKIDNKKNNVINKREKILLVENDSINQKVILTFLKDNYDVDLSVDGESAIKKCEENLYDCILMDIALGAKMNGLEATKKIRKINSYKNVPVIAITAYAAEADYKKCIEEGCDKYLLKPFSKEQLNLLLDETLHLNSKNKS